MAIRKTSYTIGLLSGLILSACAGLTYKHYGLSGVRYEEGKLLGPEPKYDRAFSECAPDAQYKFGKCIVMFYSDFKSFKLDYEDTKMRLIDCEKRIGQ